ncbi:MAG: hypothetical protein WC875_05825, partial [Candidatus Absconditabacterales bacterium]
MYFITLSFQHFINYFDMPLEKGPAINEQTTNLDSLMNQDFLQNTDSSNLLSRLNIDEEMKSKPQDISLEKIEIPKEVIQKR